MANRALADRNLLFGILALQMDFISRDALIDGLGYWVLHKSRPLGDILVERGNLKAAHRNLLEPLVDAHAADHGGAERSVARLAALPDIADSLASFAATDADVRRSLCGGIVDFPRCDEHGGDGDSSAIATPQLATADDSTAHRQADGARLPALPDPESWLADEGSSSSPDILAEFSSIVKHRVGERTVHSFGPYRLHERIGGGGMGVVFRAEHVDLKRTCALKMIKSGALSSPVEIERFKLEAAAAARLDHPGIVSIFDIGVERGQHYFAMAYVAGESLAQRLRGGPLDPRVAAEVVRQAAEALAHAHERNIVHRDLKPANILLEGAWDAAHGVIRGGGKPRDRTAPDPANPAAAERGHWASPRANSSHQSAQRCAVRVTDFGLAKQMDSTEAQLTQTGDVVGTPGYMAPEQAAGKRAVGFPADIYGLGAVLYHCLTGRPPFQAATPLQTVMQVLEVEPVSVRQLVPAAPLDLETICHKCLQKDPAKRYASSPELAADLGRFLDDVPILARPIGRFERWTRWCRRNALVAGLLVAVFGALTVGACGATWFAIDASRQKERALVNETIARQEKARAEETSYTLRTAWEMVVGRNEDPIGLSGLGEVVPRRIGQNRKMTVNLERAIRMAKRDLRNKPDAFAKTYEVVGNAYTMLGMRDEAEKYLNEALAIRSRQTPPDYIGLGTVHRGLGWLRMEGGDFTTAKKELAAALGAFAAGGLPSTDPAVTETLQLVAWSAINDEEFDEAEKLLTEVLARLRQRGLPEHHLDVHRTYMNLFGLQVRKNTSIWDSVASAFKIMPRLEAYFAQLDDPDLRAGFPHFKKALQTHLLAENSFQVAAKSENALPEMRAAIECLRRSMGDPTDYMAFCKLLLGQMLAAAGRDAEAETAFRESLAAIRQTNGFEHIQVWRMLNELGQLLHRQKRGDEIEPLYREFLEAQATQFGADHFIVGNAWVRYAQLARARGETAKQLDAAQRAMAIFLKTGGPKRSLFADCTSLLDEAKRKLPSSTR